MEVDDIQICAVTPRRLRDRTEPVLDATGDSTRFHVIYHMVIMPHGTMCSRSWSQRVGSWPSVDRGVRRGDGADDRPSAGSAAGSFEDLTDDFTEQLCAEKRVEVPPFERL